MIELFQNLNWITIGNHNITTIALFGLIGTFVGYWARWAWSKDDNISMRIYMFGNGKGVSRALLILGASVGTIAAAGIPEGMDFSAAAHLGFLGGLAVPQKVEDRQKEMEEETKQKFKKFTSGESQQ